MDQGPGTPDHGRYASDTGPLVLESWIHLGLVLLGGGELAAVKAETYRQPHNAAKAPIIIPATACP